jgi:hypothetical protein
MIRYAGGLVDSCSCRWTYSGLSTDLNIEIAPMSTVWALDKPRDRALWFDRRASDFRSAYLAHVHGCKFFVSRFAHVTEWISNV